MIKLDIEGREDAAIKGARVVISSPDLKMILTERLSEASHQLLLENGFLRTSYCPFKRSFDTDSQKGNPLYVRDLGFITQRVASAKPFLALGQLI